MNRDDVEIRSSLQTTIVSDRGAEKTLTGRVYLVGAGPGDPGLLTLRGAECLRRADLVLYDGLVNPLLLSHTRALAERTCRTQGPSGRVIAQDEINRRLVEAARAGKTVVRLKGGDPFVFGRGSEEAAALAAAGIPFEVVPGITAATAAAVTTGISLTHRERASAVAFITGHEDPTKTATLDYAALARFPGTLVFYMGLHRLRAISQSLISAGMSSTTPACVISRATQPLQKTVTGTLESIASLATSAQLHAPSLVIVGECVELREQARWFEDRPLFGKVIGITRPEEQADAVALRAIELGALPVLLPMVEIKDPENWDDVDAVIQRLRNFDWIIFTSVNGVDGLLNRIWATGGDMRSLGRWTKLAAIGPGTAKALEKHSLRADLVPVQYRGEALADALKPFVYDRRVLWARASRGRDVLPAELTRVGARLEQVVVYQNLDVERLPEVVMQRIENGELDWIALSSPSIARNLSRRLTEVAKSHLGGRTKLASISPVTTTAAQEAGLPVTVEASEYTWEGLFQAMTSHKP